MTCPSVGQVREPVLRKNGGLDTRLLLALIGMGLLWIPVAGQSYDCSRAHGAHGQSGAVPGFPDVLAEYLQIRARSRRARRRL